MSNILSHDTFVLAAYGLGFALILCLVFNTMLRSLLVNQALDALSPNNTTKPEADDETQA